jgi:hypothetical protein
MEYSKQISLTNKDPVTTMISMSKLLFIKLDKVFLNNLIAILDRSSLSRAKDNLVLANAGSFMGIIQTVLCMG